MLDQFFQELALGLEKFGTGAYFIVFLAVLVETVVVAGQFIPGSLIVIMAGFLCYMRVFDFSAMLASVFIAHFTGEFINYGIGMYKGRALFREESRFFKPKFLEMAETRFQASGAKLLITGQFLGFLRPFISLAAGASHYPAWRFGVAEVFACAIWAAAHLALGFFFGASWQQAVSYMRDFSIVLIVAIPLAIFSGWFIRQLLAMSGSLYRFLERLNRVIRRRPWFRRLNERHPHVFAFIDRRISLSQPWGLGATVGFATAVLLFILCLMLLWDVHTDSDWTTFDLSMVNLLAQLRTAGADSFFRLVTNLGSAPIVTVTVILAALLSFFARQHKSLFVIVGSVLLSMIASEVMEKIFQRSRPEISLHLVPAHGFSFPSGHATVAFALFGSLYYWLWNHPGVLRIRAMLAFILLLAAFLVGFSRVYLGVHYPSDVLAGFAIGCAGVITCATIASNWNRLADVQSRADYKAGIIMALYALGAVGYTYWHPVGQAHGKNFPEKVVLQQDSLQALTEAERDSTTLWTRPYVPVNVVIHGDPKPLLAQLESQKWKPVRPADFFTRGMADPVFPAFLQGKPAAFTMQQSTEEGRRILRLWPTSSVLDDGNDLWLGSVVEHIHEKKWGRIDVYHQSPDVDLALDRFTAGLANVEIHPVKNFRPRGLYRWGNEFFTYGAAMEVMMPKQED